MESAGIKPSSCPRLTEPPTRWWGLLQLVTRVACATAPPGFGAESGSASP
jgi:hypothetical protein